MKPYHWLLIGLAVGLLFGFILFWSPPKVAEPEDPQAFSTCTDKGMDYYKNVVHFPYMGRSNQTSDNLVHNQVRKACKENTGSFGSVTGTPDIVIRPEEPVPPITDPITGEITGQ